jgi:hypothetical protein
LRLADGAVCEEAEAACFDFALGMPIEYTSLLRSFTVTFSPALSS